MIISTFMYLLIIYLVWSKIIMMYYRHWYYTKQGIKTTGFPLPIFGNLLGVIKTMKKRDEYSDGLVT